MWDWVERVQNVELDRGRAVVRLLTKARQPAWLELWFPAEGVAAARLRAREADVRVLDWSAELVAVGRDEQRFELHEDAQAIELETPSLGVRLSRDPFGVKWGRADRTLLETATDLSTVHDRAIVPPPAFRLKDGKVVAARVAFGLGPNDHIAGLGERFASPDLGGRRVRNWNEDADGARTMRTYKAVPFLLTNRGYGIWVNSPGFSEWDLGAKASMASTLTAEGGALEWYIVVGDGPREVLRRYTGLTGRSPLIPAWAIGTWMSTSWARFTAEELEANIEQLVGLGIPIDVVHLDNWQKPGTWSSLEWDDLRIPDPPALLRRLKGAGYRISIWEQPYMEVGSRAYRDAREQGLLLRRALGASEPWEGILWGATDPLCRMAILDYTDPRVGEWYWQEHRPLLEAGVDLFKIDFAEEIPRDAFTGGGLTGAEVHNIYALCYAKTAFEATARHHEDAMVWARSAHAGSQRYPAVWSGDPHPTFEDMRLTLRGGLNAAASGIAHWTSDIGGYKGTPPPELYVRWAQFGLFSPLARFHGATPRWPWDYGDEAVDIVRATGRLRYRMKPYLRALGTEAHETGLPVMRPMWLEWPEDRDAWAASEQFMLGDALLVAPVLEEGGRVRFYVPEGRWLDWFSERFVQGPGWVERVEPLDRFPLLVRAESLVPMFSGAPRWFEELTDQFEVMYAGAVAEGQRRLSASGDTEGVVTGAIEVVKRGGGWSVSLEGCFPRERLLVVVDGAPGEAVTARRSGEGGAPGAAVVRVEVRFEADAVVWHPEEGGTATGTSGPEGDEDGGNGRGMQAGNRDAAQ